MSGGVDSSVTAAILKEAGYEVIGATMKVWPKELCGQEKEKACCSLKDIEDARSVCGKLGIRHYVLNFETDFRKNVIDYFAEEYLSARTPNPCIVCNEKIKFGSLLKKAQGLACDFIATGHYARIDRDNDLCRLKESIDKAKDQSYVLFCLKNSQRKGLGIAAKNPLYVTEIRPEHNVIVTGELKDVKGKRFLVKNVNWLIEGINKESGLEVKIRYNHKKSLAYIKDIGNKKAEVDF